MMATQSKQKGITEKYIFIVLSLLTLSIMAIYLFLLLKTKTFILGTQYPNSTRIENCIEKPYNIEIENNSKYKFVYINFNYCLLTHDPISDVENWYKNKAIKPFNIKNGYHLWENSFFGFSVTYVVYLMSPSCLIPHTGSCNSDISSGIGIYSYTTFILFQPNNSKHVV